MEDEEQADGILDLTGLFDSMGKYPGLNDEFERSEPEVPLAGTLEFE